MQTALLSEDDIKLISLGLYKVMKPDVVALLTDLVQPSTSAPGRATAEGTSGGARISLPSAGAGSAAASVPDQAPGGTSSSAEGILSEEAVRALVREELDAFAERRHPREDKRDKELVTSVAGAMESAIKKCLSEKPIELMSDDEVRKAMMVAIPTKTVRQHHGPVLNGAMKMLMSDPRYMNDTLTMSFPATSQLLDTHVNEAFFKIIMGVLQRIYKANAELPKNQQPHVIRGKASVVPDATDRADRAAMTQVRGGMHDPRSRSRKYIWAMFAIFLMLQDAGMELVFPDAPKPASDKGEGADYFAVRTRITASCSGVLPLAPDAPTVPNVNEAPAGSPLAGCHVVERPAHLYTIAAAILVRIVRETYTFDKEVVFHGAETLRGWLVSGNVAWKRMSHKDAEEQQQTGAWALLLPREHVRREVEIDVRTLQEKEKEAIMARHRAVLSSASANDPTVRAAEAPARGEESSSGAPSGDVGTSGGTPGWLRLLSL